MATHSRSPSWSHARSTPTESYFPSSAPRSGGVLKRRSSVIHSAPAVEPMLSLPQHGTTPQPMNINLKDLNSAVDESSEFGGGAPPSPSTLTDIILTLHASLYGAKRSVDEIREMVWRYYDGDAVFDSPLVSVHGRNRIVNQFILAFAVPGIEVRSELRDVICSDFEFDGTRAGIIDHTITVSFLPNLFRSRRSEQGGNGLFTPGPLMSQGSITPHPFANYATPTTAEGSGFSRARSMGFSSAMSPATPATPFQRTGSFSGGGWGSRPRTPGSQELGVHLTRQPSDMSPLPSGADEGVFGSTPKSAEPISLDTTGMPPSTSRDSVATPAPMIDTHPAMPIDAGIPHWSAPQGLGRSTMWILLYNLISPGRTLRSIFSVELRLLSRLEFNEAGRIVRHEDSWSMRELIDGFFPFLSLCTSSFANPVYNLERFLMGLITSWLVRVLYLSS